MENLQSLDLYPQEQMSLLVKCCMLRTSLHGQRIKLDAGYPFFLLL